MVRYTLQERREIVNLLQKIMKITAFIYEKKNKFAASFDKSIYSKYKCNLPILYR